MKQAMDVLVANRKNVGIPEDNPYFFASKSSSGYLDSWQAMNTIVQEAGVQRPELVTSTRIRKYNATVCRLFDLTPGELEWLANHMGHDINIHKDFYHLHDSTLWNMELDNDIESGDELKTTLACGGNIQEDEDADIESEENLNRTLAIGRNTNTNIKSA
ncbi:hypothetical protein ACJMK2_028047 [Sinanodonta woodiana]|uniref:Uncharacterized protein n=1 Tax=Sinanodonta woodiana TaxID=1069815 RepID=A0ABD3X5W3_SINWO